MLTSEDLASLATSIYGSEWRKPLARDRGVNERTVRRWAAEGIAKPDTALAVRSYLLSRHVVDLPPPPSDDPEIRDDAAHTVLPLILDRIVKAGAAVGWHPAELVTATMSWSADRLEEGLGPQLAAEAIESGLAQLRERAGKRH